MTGLQLYAERDGEYRYISAVGSPEQGRQVVASMEARGSWPEGHDAVLRKEWQLDEDDWLEI